MGEVETYLEEVAKWEAKWGNWLLIEEKLRPANMEKQPQPPYPMVLWRQCENYKTLLVEGGLLDQPYWMWTLVDACGVAVQNYEAKRAKTEEINKRNSNG